MVLSAFINAETLRVLTRLRNALALVGGGALPLGGLVAIYGALGLFMFLDTNTLCGC